MHAGLSGHMNVLIAGKVNHDRHGIDSGDVWVVV